MLTFLYKGQGRCSSWCHPDLRIKKLLSASLSTIADNRYFRYFKYAANALIPYPLTQETRRRLIGMTHSPLLLTNPFTNPVRPAHTDRRLSVLRQKRYLLLFIEFTDLLTLSVLYHSTKALSRGLEKFFRFFLRIFLYGQICRKMKIRT